jgi:hypothetical protein
MRRIRSGGAERELAFAGVESIERVEDVTLFRQFGEGSS